MLKFSVVSFYLLMLFECGYSQGCSDAGFCSIGNLNQQKGDSVQRGQKLIFLLPAGLGDENVFVFTPAIQYENQFSQQWGIQIKLTANYANGNLGHARGPGDLFLSGTRTFINNKEWNTSLTIGTKLPLNTGNLRADGKSLPMQYQSSLGTIDLITGLSISNKHWQFAAGLQQPLSGINRNNFLPDYWNTPEAGKYPPSNDFNRKGDVLLRTVYTFSIKRRISVNAGLLGIYHLNEDTYINANISNDPIVIKGSEGLTLNATLAASWTINAYLSVGITAGTPLVYRDVRPDGLTRSIVVSPEFRWNF
ncbi:MAG: hypothetical protein JNJ75_13500 [Cyclobacteriaceae bacterium]|nr:hypothetical protein [Cyclobacteriaceae bacterium]